MREKRGRVFIHIAPCPPSHPSPNSPQKGSLGTLPFCQYPYTPASLPMSISEEYRIKTWQRQREPARSQRASSRHKQLLPPDADLAPRARRPRSLLHCDTPASTALGLSRQGHAASLYFPAAGKMEKAKARHSRTPHAHEMGRWKPRKGVR